MIAFKSPEPGRNKNRRKGRNSLQHFGSGKPFYSLSAILRDGKGLSNLISVSVSRPLCHSRTRLLWLTKLSHIRSSPSSKLNRIKSICGLFYSISADVQEQEQGAVAKSYCVTFSRGCSSLFVRSHEAPCCCYFIRSRCLPHKFITRFGDMSREATPQGRRCQLLTPYIA